MIIIEVLMLYIMCLTGAVVRGYQDLHLNRIAKPSNLSVSVRINCFVQHSRNIEICEPLKCLKRVAIVPLTRYFK